MIIVIGASGFIGTYLVDALVKQGYDVTATGRNKSAEQYYNKRNIQYIQLDITKESDFDKLPSQCVEAVVLLAALLPANVQDYHIKDYVDANIMGTINVLEYCRSHSVKKLISTTSYADVQNEWKKGAPIPSEAPRNYKYTGDHAVYVITKSTASDLIAHYNQEYGLSGAIFRLPPVYGVGPHSQIYADGKQYKSGMQVFIEKAMQGEPIEIYGDSHVTRDIVYIKDVVKAFILALTSPMAKGMYNITSGTELSLEDRVKDIIDVFSPVGKKSEIIYRTDKANNSTSYVFDISKANKDFGYVPEYVPFKKLLLDYKREMELSRFGYLIERSKK